MVAVILIAIVALLILVHEWGHFIAARRSGIRVDEFGFGFPPRLFGFKKGDTLYSLNLIPLGGFVKIYGEDGVDSVDKTSFASHSVLTRARVIVAGVFMNLVLAYVFIVLSHGLGVPTPFEGVPPPNFKNPELQILGISPGSPAEKAGLKAGDAVIFMQEGGDSLDAQALIEEENLVRFFQNFIAGHAGKEVNFSIKRGTENFDIKLAPRVSPPEGEGPLGVLISKVGRLQSPWYLAPWDGLRSTFDLTKNFLVAFGGIIKEAFATGKVTEQLTGPVGIVVFTAQATELGLIYLVQLVAILSINLAIINILPFPALDGGRLVFLLLEKIKGSPVSRRVEQWAHAAGFFLLILLMVLVTWRDIHRFF